MKNKTHIVIRFGITDKFTDADMENLLSEFQTWMESGKYSELVCGTLEMGYERQKFNPLNFRI